jgi:hypothetical protein
MKPVRNVLCLLLAATLSAFALSAGAAKPPQAIDKSYSVEFLLPSKVPGPNGTLIDNPLYDPATVVGDNVTDDKVINPPVTVTVYVKNEAPPSSAASNISSLSFVLSPSLVVVPGPNAVTCPNALCSVTGNTVTVTNISPPVHAQEVYPVTLQVNTCVVVNEAFIGSVIVSTGSQVTNGQPFSLFANDDSFKPALTLSTRGASFPIDFTQKVTPVATGISCGNIACGQPFSIGNDDPTTQPYKFVSGWRGLNADGTCSGTTNLSYFVTNQLGASIAADQLVHFTWSSDPNSPQSFGYKLTRNTSMPGTGTWQLGWLLLNGQLVTIPAPICNGVLLTNEPTTIDDLPLPKVYGLLTQDVKPNTKQLKVDTGTNLPPTVTGDGLPIVIQGERMLVTSIDSSGWSVTRTASLFHSAGLPVASTPMPLLDSGVTSPPYTALAPAKMCMAWTNGTSAWIIDQSDGWGVPR